MPDRHCLVVWEVDASLDRKEPKYADFILKLGAKAIHVHGHCPVGVLHLLVVCHRSVSFKIIEWFLKD